MPARHLISNRYLPLRCDIDLNELDNSRRQVFARLHLEFFFFPLFIYLLNACFIVIHQTECESVCLLIICPGFFPAESVEFDLGYPLGGELQAHLENALTCFAVPQSGALFPFQYLEHFFVSKTLQPV